MRLLTGFTLTLNRYVPHKVEISALTYSLCYFGLMSVFAIYVSEVLQFSATRTSVVIMTVGIGSKIARLLVAPLIDKLTPDKAAILGLYGLFISSVILGVSVNFYAVCLSAFLFSLCYGFNSMLVRTIIGLNNDDDQRTMLYIRLSVITNIASLFAPLVAIYLFENLSPIAPFYLISLMSGLLLILGSHRSVEWNQIPNQSSWLLSLRTQFVDITYIKYFIITFMCWFIYAQLFSSIPIYIHDMTGSSTSFSVILIINAVSVIVLSKCWQKLHKRFSLRHITAIEISLALHAAGYLGLHYSTTFPQACLSVLIWSAGEILLFPSLQSSIAGYSSKQTLVSVLIINSIAMGLGEGLGVFTGIMLLKTSDSCFMIFALFSILVMVVCLFLYPKNAIVSK